MAQFDTQLNGTLWPPENPSWSRLEPGPEADAAWEVWEPFIAFPITRQDVIRLGKDPDTVARFDEEYWGLGPDAYPAALDVIHEIHCINALRKVAFEDFFDETPKRRRRGEIHYIHLRHCTDMLLQNVMCHADADLVTFNWMDTQSFPFPDMSINRKCRDLDALIRWKDERVVDTEKYLAWRKPPGVKQIPAEKGYYEMFGYNNSDLFPDLK